MSHALLAGLARTTEPRTMLRRFLALDAAVTGANGLAYAVASAPLSRLLGVDATLLSALGVLLVLYSTAVGLVAARPSATAVKLIVDANALWAALSVVALAAWLEPTTAGTLWIPAQAVTVAAFAALQWSALRADRSL
ncbi:MULTISPECIES: hypothetical protein [unclassified Streptomyces]|uniref:hypothetical protein n=1 Tax=unclassified Streptomyces TaxID=2593676 RepID=UPI0008DDC2AB|nr:MULTISPECIES: hypothetical protein [unclassified Streptomyces]OII64664.1 hypothetical protein BJP39_29370 [Streptomyces sp. CC77]